MPPPKDLLGLLEVLASTHSPSSKLRLLAHSWKLVKNLTPKGRERLFAAQGLKEAGSLLRRVGDDREEKARGLLLALAERVEGTDVDTLGDLFRRVKRGGIPELIDTGLSHLEEQIRGSRGEQKPPLNVDPLPLDLEPSPDEPPAPPEATPPATEPPARPSRERERVMGKPPRRFEPSSPPEPPPERDESPPAPEPPPRRASPPQTTREEASKKAVEPDSLAQAAPETEKGRPPPVRPKGSRESEKRPGDGSLLEKLSSTQGLPARFRFVRDHLAELSGSGDPSHWLEAFPSGWARRRLVAQLIRARGVDFDQACELVQQLSASGEHWCISAILECYPLDEGRLQKLLHMVRSPLSKRRVHRHFQP